MHAAELCKTRNATVRPLCTGQTFLWNPQARNNVSRERARAAVDRTARSFAPSICRLERPVGSHLDAMDWKILKELQEDGSITNVELARRIGISAPPCLRRVRALQQAGYIKGYRGLLDEKKLGFQATAFAMVHLASQTEADLAAFEAFVGAQPVIRECWMLSGDVDFLLKCVAPDLPAFEKFVGELTAAPNVRNVRTSLAFRQTKDAPTAPL
jgi:DNA-binding Lrp family transcriptional regulator